MSQLLAQVVSAAVVGALSPVAIMAMIAVLAAERNPLRNGIALLCGWTALLIVLGGALLALFGGNGPALSDSTKAVLNVIIGLLLLSFGLRNLLGDQHPLEVAVDGQSEHAAPAAPQWMSALDKLTVLKAFGIGAVLLAVSPADLAVYLSALQGLAGRSVATGIVVTALLIIAIDLCMLVPLGIYLAMPKRAGHILEVGRLWLIAHQRKLMAWVCAVFGVLLFVSGLVHLV